MISVQHLTPLAYVPWSLESTYVPEPSGYELVLPV